MRVKFRVIGGPHQGAVFSFEEHASFVVGRHRKTQFRLSLKDPYLSRFHFYVELSPPICTLVDLQSTNQTYVNGEAIQRVELADGDRIKAGKSTLVVSIEQTESLPEEPASSPHIPSSIGPYLLKRELGSGASGTVFLATDERDLSLVALKVIDQSSPGALKAPDRLDQEARALRALGHPNIIALYEVGRAERWHYLAMEYLPGVDAVRLVESRTDEPLSIREASSIVAQVLDGLAHAHAAGIIHRDVKPGNVLVTRSPRRRPRAKLADFGLAMLSQNPTVSRITKTNTLLGSIGFVAPEQIRDSRKAEPASDVYGAAATLFYLLTGDCPHRLPEYIDGCLSVILNEDARLIGDLRRDVPPTLAEAIRRSLEAEPEDRLDARALRQALDPWVDPPADG